MSVVIEEQVDDTSKKLFSYYEEGTLYARYSESVFAYARQEDSLVFTEESMALGTVARFIEGGIAPKDRERYFLLKKKTLHSNIVCAISAVVAIVAGFSATLSSMHPLVLTISVLAATLAVSSLIAVVMYADKKKNLVIGLERSFLPAFTLASVDTAVSALKNSDLARSKALLDALDTAVPVMKTYVEVNNEAYVLHRKLEEKRYVNETYKNEVFAKEKELTVSLLKLCAYALTLKPVADVNVTRYETKSDIDQLNAAMLDIAEPKRYTPVVIPMAPPKGNWESK